MIRATGKLAGGDNETFTVEWRDGEISGDALAVEAIRGVDQLRSIGGWFVAPGMPAGTSWFTDSIGFAVLVRETFAPGVEIVADAGEPLEPEQLAENTIG